MSEAAQEEVKKVRVNEKKHDTREIDFVLTNEEIIEKAQAAAELRIVSASLEAEFLRVKSTYKGRLEEKKNQISALLDVIREGREKRVTDVTDIFNYEHAVVETYVGERKVGERTMTAEERQIGLFPGMEHKRKKKAEAQSELPLDGEAPAPEAEDDDMADQAPHVLAEPKQKGQEEIVNNAHLRKNLVVEFHGLSWLLEPGDMATFQVIEDEAFGQPVLTWKQINLSRLGKSAPTE